FGGSLGGLTICFSLVYIPGKLVRAGEYKYRPCICVAENVFASELFFGIFFAELKPELSGSIERFLNFLKVILGFIMDCY
ncbi:hypothetical protein, partial [Pseudomonas avellanae]